MGYNTFVSLNCKALPNRVNYVITKNHVYNIKDNNVNKIFTSIEDLNDWYQRWCVSDKDFKYEDLYILGGAKIYKEFLQLLLLSMSYPSFSLFIITNWLTFSWPRYISLVLTSSNRAKKVPMQAAFDPMSSIIESSLIFFEKFKLALIFLR